MPGKCSNLGLPSNRCLYCWWSRCWWQSRVIHLPFRYCNLKYVLISQITIFFFSADFSLSKHIFSVIKYSFSVTISSYSTEDCSDQPIVTPGLNLNSCLNGYYYDSTLVSVGEFDYFPTTLPTYAIFTTNNCEAGKLLVLLSSFTDFK